MDKPGAQPQVPNGSNANDGDEGTSDEKPAQGTPRGFKKWLLRYGAIGLFLFFLIKGLIWIAVAVVAWWGVRGL